MGAAESRESHNTTAGASRPRDEEPEAPSPLAVAGAIGAAAVGAGLLWKMSRPPTTETPAASVSSTFLEYRRNGDDAMDADLSENGRSIGGEGGGWKAPPVWVWKLNVDGSHTQGVRGGVGGVVRDHMGEPIMAFACAFQAADTSVHELQAIRVGLELVGSLQNRRRIIVATDNAEAARLLQGEGPPKRQAVQQLVEEIKEMMKRMGIWGLEKIDRKANGVADHLCRECRWIGSGQIWFWNQNHPKQIKLKEIDEARILPPQAFPEKARRLMDEEIPRGN